VFRKFSVLNRYEVLGEEDESKKFRDRIKETIRKIREVGLIGLIRERRKKHEEVEFQILTSEGIEESESTSESVMVVPEKEEVSVSRPERRKIRGL